MDNQELAAILGYGLVNPPVPPPGELVDPFADPSGAPLAPEPAMVPDAGLADPFGAVDPVNTQMPQAGGRVSTSGFSPTKMGQVQKATRGYDKKIADAEAAARSKYDSVKAGFADASLQAEMAADELMVREQETIAAKARHQGTLAKQQADFQREEQLAWADAQAASNQAKMEYQAKLLEIPTVNPTQLWDNLGAGGQFAMGAAAFMHDFLGAKGIKTSAMDTWNKSVDRNIDAQIQNINAKQKTAAGFKDLWEMTRAQSATDTEARTRMRGFALKSLEAELDSQMGAYDSKLAGAKHQAAKAMIAKELNTTLFNVEKHIDDAAAQAATRQVTMRGQDLAASTAKADRDLRRELAAKEKPAKEDGPDFVFDPETGKGKFKFKSGVSVGQREKVLEQVGKFEAANITMNKLRELERKAGTQVVDPLKGTRFSDEQQREFDELATQLAHELVAARGERPTDKDVEQQLKALPQNTTFTVGGTSRILAGTQMGLNNAMHGQIRQFVDDVPEGEQPAGAGGRLAEGSYTDANITNKGEAAAARASDALEKTLGDPQAFAADTSAPKDAQTAWKGFLKDNKIAPDTKRRAGKDPDMGSKIAAHTNAPDKAFVAVHELGKKAVTDQAAYDALVNLVNKKGEIHQTPSMSHGEPPLEYEQMSDEDKLLRDYATWEKQLVDNKRRK